MVSHLPLLALYVVVSLHSEARYFHGEGHSDIGQLFEVDKQQDTERIIAENGIHQFNRPSFGGVSLSEDTQHKRKKRRVYEDQIGLVIGDNMNQMGHATDGNMDQMEHAIGGNTDQMGHVMDGFVDQRLIFTCRDRCGQTELSFPCSCSSVCILYDSCCENITQDCPDVIQDGRNRFSPFMGRVECKEWHVYTVTSAPCLPGASSNGSSHITDVVLSDDEIKQYIIDAPVTDSVSGLTFIPRTVYDCYKNFSNFTSSTLTWGLKLIYWPTLTYKNGYPNIVRESVYGPTFNKTSLTGHWCRRDVITSCFKPQDQDLEDEEFDYLVKKCASFAGLVKARSRLYRNRFCALCNGIIIEEMFLGFLTPDEKGSIGLSIIVSLEEVGDYNLQIASNDVDLPWSKAQCPSLENLIFNSENIERTDKTRENDEMDSEIQSNSLRECKATECGDPRFALDSGGFCRAEYHMRVVFKDNEVGLPPLGCKSAVYRMSEFIACSLELALDYGAWTLVSDFSIQKVSVAFETTTGEIFYFVDITFASAYKSLMYDYLNFAIDDFFPNFQNLAVVVKTFHRYRMMTELCETIESEEDSGEVSVEDFNLTSELFRWADHDYITAVKYDHMPVLRGEVVDDVNTTVICFSRFVLSSEPLSIACMEDLVYKGDKSQMDKVLASSCVDYLQQRAFAACFYPSVLALVCFSFISSFLAFYFKE